jgi:excisionase family DNA binding protein
MSRRKPTKIDAARSPTPCTCTDQFVSIEEVARRLHADVSWVREKIRRRCRNAIPVYNLGRHLLFDWQQVSEWVRNSPRPIHTAHRRRSCQ